MEVEQTFLPTVTLAGKQIKVVQYSKCLGVTIDNNLKNAPGTFSTKVNKKHEKNAKTNFVYHLFSRNFAVNPIRNHCLG